VLWAACARHPGGLLSGLPDWTLARLYRLFPVIIASALPLALLRDASIIELVEEMLLLSHKLNGPAWSLQVEMPASLALFLVHRTAGGTMRGAGIAFCLSLLVCPLLLRLGLDPAIYFPAFLAGALIGAMPTGGWRPWLLLPGLVALLLGSLFLGHGATGRAAETLGAVLVVGTVGAWQPRALLHPAPQFFGRISYPLYLSHTLGLMLAGPVVAASGFGTFGQIVVYAVVSLGVAVPVAWLLHVAVEAPTMAAWPRLRVVEVAP
jgi:peptidoglycan/LPS O-acetylase OafA/YrhL